MKSFITSRYTIGTVLCLTALGGFILATPHPAAESIGIWRSDARLGYAHIPFASGKHRTEDFDVRYSIDAMGCRVTPNPARARGTVLMLGDSFTFGHGVSDDAAYPALLGAHEWTAYKVRNCAVMGWGTGQAELLAADMLKREKPRAIIYGWIWPDAKRNYLRRSWLETLALFKRRNVHFELDNAGIVYKGTSGPEISVADSAPDLSRKERELTYALIRSMAEIAAAAGVKFYVALLPFDPKTNPIDEELVAVMRQNGIAFIDLRDLKVAFFAHDGHPAPAWHHAVAAAVAAQIRFD